MIRLRSTYSINKSVICFDEYIKWLKEHKKKSAILVDVNTSSFVSFFNLCKKNNLFPIIGFEKENEYIIFPTNEDSLINFYSVVNGDESSFTGLIVYKLETNNEFPGAFKIIKNFDHDVYNALEYNEYYNSVIDEQINICTIEDYKIDVLLIENTTYKLNMDFKLYKFKNDDQLLVSLIKKQILKNKINLTGEQKKRLNYELKIIREKNFASYFLIFYKIINYLNDQKILYGFGRGSSASSYVCYLLNITKIDPLQYGLIFERFLNKGRVDFPDIDLDIDSTKRVEVMNFILSTFKNSAQISTFNHLGLTRAQKIVNEKFKLPQLILSKISKNEDIELLIKTDKRVNDFIKNVNKLKNIIIGKSVHPAGIIISNVELNKYCQVTNGIINADYYSLEFCNFVKFDLLNLNALNNILKTTNLIKKYNAKRVPFDLNDQNVFKMLNNLETKYLFQIDSSLSRQILNKFKINSFDDLAILISLNRPGTKSLVERIVNNQKQKKNSNKTYDVLIFQEQIINMLANEYNLSPSQSDIIRTAISKKDETKLKKLEKYILSKNMNLKYLNYAKEYTSFAFNKAHAYSYAKLVMQIAYFKYYYPLEFMLGFTNDSLELNDIQYLKTLNININGFTKNMDTEINGDIVKLGLKYLKIDPKIKKFISENKINELVELRNNFDRISDRDIKEIIFSEIFRDKIQTSDKFEIENNSISSLMRMRNWSKLDNKIANMYTEKEFYYNQLLTFGFCFSNVFSTNWVVEIEHFQKYGKVYRGTLISNLGRFDFIMYENLNFEIGKRYLVRAKFNFYDRDQSVIIYEKKSEVEY